MQDILYIWVCMQIRGRWTFPHPCGMLLPAAPIRIRKGDAYEQKEKAPFVAGPGGADIDRRGPVQPAPPPRRGVGAGSAYAADKELQEIFERTYGKVARRAFEPAKKPARTSLADHYDVTIHSEDTEYLLVDGYNIIFAWPELKELADADVRAAQTKLMDVLSNYQGYKKCTLILVFLSLIHI